jgi:hypothetical protein
MKKLKLKIPKWRGDRKVYIFFGREQYAVIDQNDTVHIKIERCNYCGLCCQEPGEQFPEYIPEGEDKKYCAHCRKDVDEWVCENPAVPYSCLTDEPPRLPHKDCVMRYKVKK